MGSGRASCDFPTGLRVLVVDRDYESSNKIERMLKNLNYAVMKCNTTQGAMKLLRETNGIFSFDIIMTDVSNGDVDDFEFLKYVNLNLKIPVIIMTGDGETSKIMKGVQYGACGHLLKPVQKKELRFIWQHVFRKRMQQQQQYRIEDSRANDDVSIIGKRKDREHCSGSSSSNKKPRLVWTEELDFKFKKAVEEIGIEKATPKRILTLMGDSSLTRDNISSRLQKFKIKMGKKAAATSAQLFQHPADLHSQISNCSGHFPGQPFDFQNPRLQSPESKTERSFNDRNLQPQCEYFDPSLAFQSHVEPAVQVPCTMQDNEQNMELAAPSCPSDFPQNQNHHQWGAFGDVVLPHDANDPDPFDDDFSSLMEKYGVSSWFDQ